MLRLNQVTVLTLAMTIAACGGEEMGETPESDIDVATSGLQGCYIAGATEAEAAERTSPLRQTEFSVGATDALLCYGAPSANDREIMGGLVPFGEMWRAGANEATTLHLAGPATVGDLALEAGSYSIYVRPGAEAWEIFLNPEFERWGIPVNAEVRETELGSFTVASEASEGMTETLTYSYESTGEGAGEIILEWEETRVRIPISAGAAN
ncbi:MAG: DUF2911 domain-containing protein [Longimicrobiales bacterium]|nr:DUF2911 domain-containing protein [Longimicrobiales bacterium]